MLQQEADWNQKENYALVQTELRKMVVNKFPGMGLEGNPGLVVVLYSLFKIEPGIYYWIKCL